MTLSVAEAQARLPELLAGLQPGDTLTLTQNDRPIADLVARPRTAPPPKPKPDMRAILDEVLRVRPQTPTPRGRDYLKEGKESGELYGYEG